MTIAEGMPLPGQIDRFAAENALRTLREADVILSQPQLMKAVGEVAAQERDTLERFSPEDLKSKMHGDADREGKVNF
jgi:hypothetical protein